MVAYRNPRATAERAIAIGRARVAAAHAELAGMPGWLQVGDPARLPDPADALAATRAAELRDAIARDEQALAQLDAALDAIDGPRPPSIRLFLRWSQWLEGLPDAAHLLAELHPDPRRLFLGAEPAMTAATADRIIATVAARGGRVGDGQSFVQQAGLTDDDVFDLDETAANLLDPLPPDASLGVLLPLRLETRYRRPGPGDQWILMLRVFPDPVATDQPPATATEPEAAAVAACWTQAGGDLGSATGPAAWSALVAAVGGPRAAWLMRTVPVSRDGAGFVAEGGDFRRQGDTTTAEAVALPDVLQVWGDRGAGLEPLGELHPDLEAIAAQSDFAALRENVTADHVPDLWWTSFDVARTVGLATEIPLGNDPHLRVLLVTGLAAADAPLPFPNLSARGTLGVLSPMTPTNTVAGQPAADLGDSATAWLAAAGPASTSDADADAVVTALTGRTLPGVYAPGFPPQGILGAAAGTAPDVAPGSLPSPLHAAGLLVTALWPVLWQRMMKDVAGVGEQAWAIGEWARRLVAPLGPFAPIRVDEVPYGVLPVADLDGWVAGITDPPWESGLRDRSRTLLPMWTAAAESAGTATGADTAHLLEILGRVPTAREPGSRLLLPVELRVLLAAALSEPDPTAYLDLWRRADAPWADLGLTATRRFWTFGGVDRVLAGGEPVRDSLERYFGLSWETLAFTPDNAAIDGHGGKVTPGFLARLLRHAFVLTQAEVNRLSPDNLPSWQPTLDLGLGDARKLAILAEGADRVLDLPRFARDAMAQQPPDARVEMVCRQFQYVREAAREIAALGDAFAPRAPYDAALSAVLDTSSHRLDPWITALATRRLRRLSARGVPRRLGAYGWVDDLSPRDASTPPTRAGLLHAPSHTQAVTSAVLRDKAIRTEDATWQLQIESSSARLAKRLGDDVRLGIHLSEAIGREIERRAGEPGRVVDLRRRFPARPEWAGRRVCDGLLVLAAAEAGDPAVADLGPLADLRHVLDTYGDLLVADAVHDVVSGRGGAAAEAMHAAAGLAAPPELRFLHTAREGWSVKTTVLAALPAGDAAGIGAGPVAIVDPFVAALVNASVPAESWTFADGAGAPTLAQLGLSASDTITIPEEHLRAAAETRLGAPSTGGSSGRARVTRLARVFGAQTGLPDAAAAGSGADQLLVRLTALRAAAASVAAAGDDASRLQWGLPPDPAEADVVLAQRLSAAGDPAGDATLDAPALTERVRALVAPVETLPLVCAAPLPALTAAPGIDRDWLEVVAAVRPAMARLEAVQVREAWPAACDAPARLWTRPAANEHRVIAYGPGVGAVGPVGIAVLDVWAETVPSGEHATWAAFGYDAPRARAPQAVLLAIPADEATPLSAAEIPRTVLSARSLARARMAMPDGLPDLVLGVPSSLLLAAGPAAAEVVES
jgi:hypothetical protein